MKIVAINGSHRAGKSSSKLAQRVLDVCAAQGWETQLVELAHHDIQYCIGCNSCLKQCPCPLQDSMTEIMAAVKEAQVVVVASPNYFEGVTARMKCFMDRTRPEHLAGNVMAGKLAGIVCTTGLGNCGSDTCVEELRRFCDGHGWITVGATKVVGSWQVGVGEDGRVQYRPGADQDPAAQKAAENLAHQLMATAEKLFA